jgi:hypothetical protein
MSVGRSFSCASHRLRQPEVEHLHRAVLADFDIRRLEVAMDDALLVRHLKRVRDLARDDERLVERNRSLRNALRERRPLDELHHEGSHVAGVFQTINRCDVGVIQRRQDVRSALKPSQPIGIVQERLGEHFQRDVTVQLGVAGSIHLSHTACAEQFDNLESAETNAGCEIQFPVVVDVPDEGTGRL